MHRDVFGDDHLVQHPGRAVFHRLCTAAAAARKQRVRRDDDGRVRDVLAFLRDRNHRRLCQRYLPGKDLDALNAHGAVAGFCCGQADNGVRADGVVLVQREGAGGGFNGDVGGAAGRIGDAVQGKAVPLHRNGHPLHGGRLAGRKGLDADGAVAGLGGHEVTDRVGALRGVVLVQRESTGGGGKGDVVGVAFGVGQAGGGEAVAADGDGHTLDRAGLTGRKGLNAESSGVLHGDTLLCW